MAKSWKKYRLIFTTIFLVYLIVAFILLVLISGVSELSVADRNTMLLLVFSLSLVAIGMFVFSFLQLKDLDGKSTSSSSPPAEGIQQASKEASEEKTIQPNKQGRLVKKLRHIMANVEDSSPERLGDTCLSSLAHEYAFVQGLFYLREPGTESFHCKGSYAWYSIDQPASFLLGESLNGQAAKDGKLVCISNIPENYVEIHSGLGHSSPRHLYIVPLVHDGQALGLIELASFREFDPFVLQVIQAMAEHVAASIADLFFKNVSL